MANYNTDSFIFGLNIVYDWSKKQDQLRSTQNIIYEFRPKNTIVDSYTFSFSVEKLIKAKT